jgi:tellurite resistance protein TehA-like permease
MTNTPRFSLGFRILWWIDIAVALVVGTFFLVGLGDGSISSFNAGLWALLLLVVAVVVFGSRALYVAGHHRLAKVLALVLAVPGIIAVLFIVLILVTQPRWN